MKTPLYVLCLAALVFFVAVVSCKKKNKPPRCDGKGSTYNTNIKPILNTYCTGCHANYNSYSGLREVLYNGSFKSAVIENKTMPRGRSLSSDELIKIQCWADAGFPEN